MRKLTMVAAAFAVALSLKADEDTVGGYTWTYQINGDKAEIGNGGSWAAAVSPDPTGAITIPSTLGGKTVTGIGHAAFVGCRNLTSVTIPDGVTSIGQWAFYGCSGLTSVTIPDSVTSIGEGAFEDCSILTSIDVSESNPSYQSVGGLLLSKDGKVLCAVLGSLTGVTIPDSVTSIGEFAFEGCTGLTSVNIPDSVTSIGGYAFYGCSGLTSVTIPDSVTSIGSGAFSGCSGLTSVTIPDSVTSIGYQAFSGCSGLTSVTIPDSVTSIGYEAFEVCIALTSVTIPDSVTSIGEEAFSGCSGLTSVTIPDSVTSIEWSAFEGCSESLFDTTTIPGVKLVDGWAVDSTESLSGDLTLAGIRGIGWGAFFGCSGLTSVTMSCSFQNRTGVVFKTGLPQQVQTL